MTITKEENDLVHTLLDSIYLFIVHCSFSDGDRIQGRKRFEFVLCFSYPSFKLPLIKLVSCCSKNDKAGVLT